MYNNLNVYLHISIHQISNIKSKIKNHRSKIRDQRSNIMYQNMEYET